MRVRLTVRPAVFILWSNIGIFTEEFTLSAQSTLTTVPVLAVLLYRTVDALRKTLMESLAAVNLTHAAALDSTPYLGDAEAAPPLAAASAATATAASECTNRSS